MNSLYEIIATAAILYLAITIAVGIGATISIAIKGKSILKNWKLIGVLMLMWMYVLYILILLVYDGQCCDPKRSSAKNEDIPCIPHENTGDS
jgi:hypothetical protein